MSNETKDLLETILKYNEKIRLTENFTLLVMFLFFLLGIFTLFLSMMIAVDMFFLNPNPVINSNLKIFFSTTSCVIGLIFLCGTIHQLNFHYKNLKPNNFSIKKTKELFIKERDVIIEKMTDKNLMILLDETKEQSVNSCFYNETNRRIALKLGLNGVADQKEIFLYLKNKEKSLETIEND